MDKPVCNSAFLLLGVAPSGVASSIREAAVGAQALKGFVDSAGHPLVKFVLKSGVCPAFSTRLQGDGRPEDDAGKPGWYVHTRAASEKPENPSLYRIVHRSPFTYDYSY